MTISDRHAVGADAQRLVGLEDEAAQQDRFAERQAAVGHRPHIFIAMLAGGRDDDVVRGVARAGRAAGPSASARRARRKRRRQASAARIDTAHGNLPRLDGADRGKRERSSATVASTSGLAYCRRMRVSGIFVRGWSPRPNEPARPSGCGDGAVLAVVGQDLAVGDDGEAALRVRDGPVLRSGMPPQRQRARPAARLRR